MSFSEAISVTYAKSITFIGGHGPNFEIPNPGTMTIVNSLTLTYGAITVENLVVR